MNSINDDDDYEGDVPSACQNGCDRCESIRNVISSLSGCSMWKISVILNTTDWRPRKRLGLQIVQNWWLKSKDVLLLWWWWRNRMGPNMLPIKDWFFGTCYQRSIRFPIDQSKVTRGLIFSWDCLPPDGMKLNLTFYFSKMKILISRNRCDRSLYN